MRKNQKSAKKYLKNAKKSAKNAINYQLLQKKSKFGGNI